METNILGACIIFYPDELLVFFINFRTVAAEPGQPGAGVPPGLQEGRQQVCDKQVLQSLSFGKNSN